MKKLLALGAFTSLLAAMTPTAHAGTASGTFTVDVTLTSTCVATSTTPSINFGTYVAFGAGPTTPAPNAAITFECTRGFAAAPTVLLVNGALGTNNNFTPGAAGATTSGSGTIAGLTYTLNVAAGAVTADTAATLPGVIGNVDKYSYTITGGGMVANQAGDASAGTSSGLSLQVTY